MSKLKKWACNSKPLNLRHSFFNRRKKCWRTKLFWCSLVFIFNLMSTTFQIIVLRDSRERIKDITNKMRLLYSISWTFTENLNLIVWNLEIWIVHYHGAILLIISKRVECRKHSTKLIFIMLKNVRGSSNTTCHWILVVKSTLIKSYNGLLFNERTLV